MTSNRLKKYRKSKGYTQVQLAEELGVSKDYISQIERGIKNPGFKLSNKISILLEQTVDEIFFKKQ